MSFLFGPKSNQVGDVATLRPMAFDIDVVLEVCEVLERRLGEAKENRIVQAGDPAAAQIPTLVEAVTLQLQPGTPEGHLEVLPPEKAVGLSRRARQHLTVRGGGAFVDFRAETFPSVFVTADAGFDSATATRVTTELVQLLVREGRARPQWRRWTLVVPPIFMALLPLVWAWVWTTTAPSAAEAVFGTLITGAAVIGLVALVSWQRAWIARHPTGHRFRENSREQLRDALARWKASALVGVVGAVVGAAATYLATLAAS